jgi:hypothetical protein
MKPLRPVTVSLIGVCGVNVGIAFVESAFGKATDPLTRLPPSGTVYTMAAESSASIVTTTMPDMSTGTPRDLTQLFTVRRERGNDT